jgi:hypothetical protein
VCTSWFHKTITSSCSHTVLGARVCARARAPLLCFSYYYYYYYYYYY